MDYENELRGFLDEDLKLKQLPSKSAKKIVALHYISEKLLPVKQYSEKEVNEVIKSVISFGGHSLVRRELVDAKLISRSNDRRIYMKTPDACT
jgi:hypothetical protein